MRKLSWRVWAALALGWGFAWGLVGFKYPTKTSGSIPGEPASPFLAQTGYYLKWVFGIGLAIAALYTLFIIVSRRIQCCKS